MLRYLRLFAYFVRFSFSRAMEFRVDFFFRIIMDVVYYSVNILFFQVIFNHTTMLGGWTENEMMIFIAAFLMIDAISMTLFSNNLWMLSSYVNRGDLDYHLIRPCSSLFVISLRDFAANSFMNLLITIGIMCWALIQYEGHITAAKVVMFLCLIGLGTYLRYCVRMLCIIPVFWLHQGQGLEIVFFHMARFVERPDRIFTGPVRVILTTVLPFCLMASYPARIFIDGFEWNVFLTMIAVTVVFSFAVVTAWRAGLRAYSSASS